MVDNVLDQSEVESLLGSMDPEGSDEDQAGPIVEPSPFPQVPREKVSVYDFKRPERVGKEQMRALQTMYEGFGRNFGAALSAMLRTIVEAKLTSVDQLTYSEFVFSLENPTCFNLISAQPLDGQLILDINPSILFPVIDRLLGGSANGTTSPRRPLTEIELRLVSRITDLFLKEMKVAWENVVELELSVDRVESNPQLVQIIPANEVVVLVSFELIVGETRGMVNLCIPFNSLEPIGNKLTSNSWASYSKRAPTKDSINTITGHISSAPVEVVVELAQTSITTRDLIELRVGDIIASEKDIKQPLDVSVEGRPKFQAKPGKFKGRKAIEILRNVEPTKLLDELPKEDKKKQNQ